MAQARTSSRKRTHCLNVPSNDSQCHCPCHSEHPHEHGTKNQKRQKSKRGLSSPLLQAAPLGSIDNCSSNLHGDPFNTFTQTNTDINSYGDEFSVFPRITSPASQRYLSFNDEHFQQQNAGPVDNTVETPASCTVTNDTLSPRSFSLNRPTVVDTAGLAAQSPSNVYDISFDGADDTSLDFPTDWQWDPSIDGPMLLSSLAGIDPPFILDPTTDVNNSTSAISSSGQFAENLTVPDGSPHMPATINRFMASGNDPWSSQLPSNCRSAVRLNGDLVHQREMSVGVLQPAVPQTTRLIAPQLSERSSTTSSTLVWNNTTLGPKSIQPLVIDKLEMKLPPKPGIRHGGLEAKKAEKARSMRKCYACWRCRLVNAECSLDSPCVRCTKLSKKKPLSTSPSPLHHILCYRGPLENYTDAFFPELVKERLSEAYITGVISENVKFTDNKIQVEMSSGPDYPVIGLTATEFHPLRHEFLAFEYVAPKVDTDDGPEAFSTSYAPPIGLYEVSQAELKKICLSHIGSIIDQERSDGEAKLGDISMISLSIFEAVNRYRKSSLKYGNSVRSALLTNSVMLYAMHYFMTRVITMTSSSAERAIERLRRPQLLPFEQASQVLTSKLINLQIKQAMQVLLRKTTRTVLAGLETQIRDNFKTKESWVDNFCVVLILCMCIELVQVTSDSYAMAAIRRDPSCNISRQNICRKLDDEPFKQLADLFRTAYKTTRAKDSQKVKLGFNPIRYGLPANAGKEFTPEMRLLINEIKHIMTIYVDEMAEVVQNPSFDDPKPDLLTHHMAFRKRNSGRLVSIFLLSFMQ